MLALNFAAYLLLSPFYV